MTDDPHRLTFTVLGDPVPQGSMRWLGNRGMIAANKTRLEPWREAIRAAAHHAMPEGWQPLTGPLVVLLWFHLRRPAAHYGTGRRAHTVKPSAPIRPAGKPDLDKLVRAAFDAMTSIGVWLDDAQVVTLITDKLYAEAGTMPRLEATASVHNPHDTWRPDHTHPNEDTLTAGQPQVTESTLPL